MGLKMRINDRKTLVKELTKLGFRLQSSGKHDKFIRNDKVIMVPKKHSTSFNRFLAERLLKDALS